MEDGRGADRGVVLEVGHAVLREWTTAPSRTTATAHPSESARAQGAKTSSTAGQARHGLPARPKVVRRNSLTPAMPRAGPGRRSPPWRPARHRGRSPPRGGRSRRPRTRRAAAPRCDSGCRSARSGDTGRRAGPGHRSRGGLPAARRAPRPLRRGASARRTPGTARWGVQSSAPPWKTRIGAPTRASSKSWLAREGEGQMRPEAERLGPPEWVVRKARRAVLLVSAPTVGPRQGLGPAGRPIWVRPAMRRKTENGSARVRRNSHLICQG